MALQWCVFGEESMCRRSPGGSRALECVVERRRSQSSPAATPAYRALRSDPDRDPCNARVTWVTTLGVLLPAAAHASGN